MLYYYLPSLLLGFFVWRHTSTVLGVLAGLAFFPATLAIPGYMTHYCIAFDFREILNPGRALRRALEGGPAYWKAWAIALSALGVSFLGVLASGVGFLFTSVWFWQVAGFSFASAFAQRYLAGDCSQGDFYGPDQ